MTCAITLDVIRTVTPAPDFPYFFAYNYSFTISKDSSYLIVPAEHANTLTKTTVSASYVGRSKTTHPRLFVNETRGPKKRRRATMIDEPISIIPLPILTKT